MKKPNLSSLVTQTEMTGEPACPKCGGDFVIKERCTTLIGYSGGLNPNHIWEDAQCRTCTFQFVIESKSGNYWITHDRKVLAGLPSCFESYTYTCKHCRGDVVRSHTAMDGTTPVMSLWTNKDGPQYRTFYTCQVCKQQIEVVK